MLARAVAVAGAVVVLVPASAAGRAGTDGADVDVEGCDEDEGAGAVGRDGAVVGEVVDMGDAAVAAAPGRSQGFGGEGMDERTASRPR